MWKDYPQDIPLETPLGVVYMAITDAGHVYVSAKNDKPINVNGSPWPFSMHMHDYGRGFEPDRYRRSDGTFDETRMQQQALYMNRWNEKQRKFQDATEAARKKVTEVMVKAVNGYLRNHRDLLTVAQEAHVNNAVESLDGKINDLRSEIQELEEQKTQLLKGLATYQKEDAK